MRTWLSALLSLSLVFSSLPSRASFATDEISTDSPEQFTIRRKSGKNAPAPEAAPAAGKKKKRITPFARPPEVAPAPAAKKPKKKAPAVQKTPAPKPAPAPAPPPEDVPPEPAAAETAPPAVAEPSPEPEPLPSEEPTPPPAPAPAVQTAPVSAPGPDKAADAALEKDLAYYRRVSAKKKMAANDRLYILYRLKEKHAVAGKADLSPLLKEIEAWEEAKRSGKAPAPTPATAAASVPPAAAKQPASPVQEEPLSSWENYVLQNGDFLDIRVAPAKELDRELAVQPDGTISFPLLGAVRAEGLTRTALERSLAQKLATYVIEPKVTVVIRRFASDAVIVTGRVGSPGAVGHQDGMGASDAVAQAGGFQADADRSGVFIYRGRDQNRETFLVDADLPRGDSRFLPLRPGDIVDVQQARDVSILGMVTKPGNYPYKKDLSLLDLVFESGGLAPGAKARSVFLYSQSDAGRKSRRINLDRIMTRSPADDPRLRPGDIVMVPQKAFYNTSGGGSSPLTQLFYLSTIVIAVVLATKD